MTIVLQVLFAVLLGLCLNTPCVEGLEFLLNNISIPTDGSGRILVTDINSSDTEALICQSPSEGSWTDWYLDPDDENATSITDEDRIYGPNDRGWTRNRNTTREGYRVVRLKRVSDTAVEGRFTCKIPGDSDSPRGLLILHSITSVNVTYEVISGRMKSFRVRCTSTGGRVLNMYVTGPDFNSELSNIQSVGTLKRMGNDIYTATTATIKGSGYPQTCNCTASNGASYLIDSVELTDDSFLAPANVTAESVLNPLSVSVVWQAVEDADRYIVTFTKTTGDSQQGLCKQSHHTAVVIAATPNASITVGQDVGPDVTTMLRAYTTYTITVAAENALGTSDGSDPVTLTTRETGAGKPPENVIIKAVQMSTITIRWDGLSQCRHANGRVDEFIVRYSAEPKGTTHMADVDVNFRKHIPAYGANITLTGLSPYTNYSIQVAAVNLGGHVGVYSDPILAQTAEDTPGPVVITAFPSLFNITITWKEPAVPNGIITHYEVYYGIPKFHDSISNTTTGLNTNFTTPGHLEPGTEIIFTVKAYTQAGGGKPATVTVSTLNKPSAVEGVTVTSLTDTSVTVSWNAVTIPDFPIDSYTVVYSPVSESDKRQDGEITAAFPGSVTSGVITDLEPAVIYRFQVFATITVDGVTVKGEWSNETYIAGDRSPEYGSCGTAPVGVAVGIVVGSAGLIMGGIIIFMKTRLMSKVVANTDDNPAYGISHKRCTETTKDHKRVWSSLTAPQEPLYEGVS